MDMNFRYFFLIHHKLYTLLNKGHYEDRGKLKVYQSDIEFLEMFITFLEEQQGIKEISLTQLIKRIWVEEDNNLEDFDPLTFGLDRKIQQSKPLIEQQCRLFVQMPMQMQLQCKSSNIITKHFVVSVVNNVHTLVSRYREATEIKNQIEILKGKLEFLLGSVSRVGECIDSKKYRKFVEAYFNNAACLVCMYWAKEDNIETETKTTEMNTALFYMLHNIRPNVADVTVLYFRVLKSRFNSHLVQSNLVGRFVDFFFKHTILSDDFLILREQLIVILTFLTDAAAATSHENAAAASEGEGDIICTQIYALFREDAYLLVPFNEMKGDVSSKKMLLSDFMVKIEILNAKIKHIYCLPSDSWTIFEAEKMNNIYFASLQREIASLQEEEEEVQVDQVHPIPYLMEIRLLRSFIQCFETWDDGGVEESKVRLSSMVTSLQRIWGQKHDMELLSGRLYAIRKGDNLADWKHLVDLELKEKFHMSKQEISAWLVMVSSSHCSFHCRPSTSNKTLKFLDSILYNMTKLVSFEACKYVVIFKKQIEILEDKLLLLKNMLKLTTNCAHSENLEEFNMLAQVFANNASCLIYMYWAEEENAKILVEINRMLSNMLHKIKPNTIHVAKTYIGTLKAICLQPCDSFLLEQTATSFVDYFFEDLITPWKNEFQILRDEVIFYLTFVHHHHTSHVEEIICSQLDVLFSDDVYDLLPFDDMKGDFFKKNVGLSNFLMNIGTENAKIRQIYCKFPDSFVYSFPRIIDQGFLYRLLQKLGNLTERMISYQNYVLFAKYKITTIEGELSSLTPIFNQIMELTYINDAWSEVVNVVYLAEHVISLCITFYHLIWHYIPYLVDVVEKIKLVRTKLEKVQELSNYNARCLPHSAGIMSTLLERRPASEIHGIMVGHEEDENRIMNNITRGTKSLDIVSIVGMGGLGKTTLAKKIYGSSSVISHFHITAFTYVSQDRDKRRLLLDILNDIVKVDAITDCMTVDDLAHKLRKCLSRRKYFVVLDDIWDINVWDEIRSSFPDDGNGSRVMFTTRSLEVAKRGQINCIPHRLRFLSEDESWMLLQKKVFHNDMPPPYLSSIAKLIADKCNGLPLAIVVIANLLARTETSLWIDISKRVSSYLFDEGYMNILEQSIKDLPEYLKPCLLYLGAFPTGSSYRVNEVTMLWIAEGFIVQESKTKSLNDVAKDYLYELVDRGFITVDKLITDAISTFRVHDLIHDLCQNKCQDENFFQLGHGVVTSSFSASSKYNHYRVSLQNLCGITGDAEPLSLVNTRSLLCFLSEPNDSKKIFPLRRLRFVQVLYLKGIRLKKSDFEWLASLIDLRHIDAEVSESQWIPLSISNLSNMQSLILKNTSEIYLPVTIWRMKSLRHVKVNNCMFEVSDDYYYELNAYPRLDKVVSFSRPILSTGKDVEWLLQKLPNVRKLSCILQNERLDSTQVLVETFDFHRRLESLKLYLSKWGNCSYVINFPSTLNKLTLERFKLSSTVISAIMELHCLRILKLRDVSFPGPTWEMEDPTFLNLKYFELCGSNLELLNANANSFPCLEQVYFNDTELEELPPFFGEISSFRKITIRVSEKLTRSAFRVLEEQMDLGNKVELSWN